MVLGKLLVPGRATDLDCSRAGACCACGGCGLFGHFFSCLSYLFSFSLGPLSLKQPTNQPTSLSEWIVRRVGRKIVSLCGRLLYV